MVLNRQQQRMTSWIAIVAMLLLGLAPVASHSLNWVRNSPAQFEQLCSSAFTSGLQAQSSQRPADSQPATHLAGAACGYCVLQAQLPFVSPDAPTQATVQIASHGIPTYLFFELFPARAWRNANPRAPPSLA